MIGFPPTNNGKSKPFPRDNRVWLLSLCGLGGLLFGFIVLSYSDVFRWPSRQREARSNFHEIAYHPQQIAGKAIKGLQDSISGVIKLRSDSLDKLRAKKSSDTTKVLARITADTATIGLLDGYRKNYEDASFSDTASFKILNELLHFQIDPSMLAAWDSAYDKLATEEEAWQWKASVTYWLKVPVTRPALVYKGQTEFTLSRPGSDDQFFSKYPTAATWVLLTVIFCSFCFIAIVTCYYTRSQLSGFLVEKKLLEKKMPAFPLMLLPVIGCMGLLMVVWLLSFNDEAPVKALYFMRTFRPSVIWINILGYIAGAFCLTGFINTASILGYFAKDLRKKTKEVQIAEMHSIQKGMSAADMKSTQDTTYKAKEEQALARELFDHLLNYFNRYFALSAGILSLLVLCTGALFSTVNGLDFIKLLTDDWGYSPAGTDLVYLYAGIHTVILLLVYVPAKMRFSEIKLGLPPMNTDPAATADTATTEPAGPKSSDLLKASLTTLKDVLVIASPLLASLVQSLLTLLFK
jgi:hypothetical protein